MGSLYRKELNFGYLVSWTQILSECLKIEPFVRCAYEGAVVEVETVDISPNVQRSVRQEVLRGPQKAKPPEGGFATHTLAWAGYE